MPAARSGLDRSSCSLWDKIVQSTWRRSSRCIGIGRLRGSRGCGVDADEAAGVCGDSTVHCREYDEKVSTSYQFDASQPAPWTTCLQKNFFMASVCTRECVWFLNLSYGVNAYIEHSMQSMTLRSLSLTVSSNTMTSRLLFHTHVWGPSHPGPAAQSMSVIDRKRARVFMNVCAYSVYTFRTHGRKARRHHML